MEKETDRVAPLNEAGEKPSLAKNYFFNLANQILSILAPLATGPYLARVLHEEGNGQISYTNSVIAIFVLVANLGFASYGQREIAKVRDNRQDKSKTFWEIFLLKSFTTLFSIALLFVLFFTVGFKKCDSLIAVSSLTLASNIVDISYLFQGEEDFKAITIRSIIIKLVHIGIVYAVIRSPNDIWLYCLVNGIFSILSCFILWPKLKTYIDFVQVKDLSLKKHLLPSFLIFLPTLAITIYAVLDKVMVGLLSDNSDYENGCYEKAYALNSMALTLVTAVSPVMMPRNSYDYKNGHLKEFSDHLYFSANYVWMVGFPLVAGFGALANSLCAWYLGAGYEEVPNMLRIMSVRFIFSGFSEIFNNQLFIAIGKEKYSTIATAIGALADLILNIFFIRAWGATGAAISTAIVEIFICSLLAFFAYRSSLFSPKKALKLSWKYVIAATIMFLTIFFTQKLLTYNVWTFLLFFAGGSIEYALLLLILKDAFFIGCLKRISGFFKNRAKH